MWKTCICSKGLLSILVVLSFLFIQCKKGRSLAATGPTISSLNIPGNDVQQQVIFDTDPGGDVDDAGALAVLHALADRGEIKILAMGVSIGHDLAVPFVDAVNTWYGRPDLPVGTIKGTASYSADYFMKNVVDKYPANLTKYNAPEVVDLYRKTLAAQPDNSVTIITVGPSTNISNLLNSAPDHHSNLTGVELVRKKVKFYAAGGNGNGGLPNGQAGFNYYMDLKSASNELNLLPADFPTVFAGGSGSKLELGSALSTASDDHIIRKSYESYYKGTAQNRPTWDQLRVLYACRPASRAYFDTSVRGKIQVNSARVIWWETSSEKNHAYAYVNDFTKVRDELLKLMLYDPRGNK
ncbi:nucleoside hydrolase [Daejeonella sp.]|uniref:nucleoside hydrolase n=1 Tax=Daejeonella sp. TaxID=2805397 RepID=UPI003C78FF3F